MKAAESMVPVAALGGAVIAGRVLQQVDTLVKEVDTVKVDVKDLGQKMATKEDFSQLVKEVDTVKVDVKDLGQKMATMATKEDINQLGQKMLVAVAVVATLAVAPTLAAASRRG